METAVEFLVGNRLTKKIRKHKSIVTEDPRTWNIQPGTWLCLVSISVGLPEASQEPVASPGCHQTWALVLTLELL